MKIVIAPDSYKESLSALEVATAIEQGFREIWPDADYLKLPLADGGEGTVEAMVEATAGRIVHVEVTGPLGHRVNAFYGLSGDVRVPRSLKWRPPAGWSRCRPRNAIR